jgi:catechol 2,3-dioxygenase-like lactoylglutathione lyase family enzyme
VEKAGALGTINSVYCRDPDGNLIEISTYGD